MNLLFLRGQEPQDRDPKETYYNSIQDCDDIWTQIAYYLSDSKGQTEILYWNGNRTVKYADNVIEKRIKTFKGYVPKFSPDVIFARGGFDEYNHILARYPKVYKIYYGANSKRFKPKDNNIHYNLILVDSHEQLGIARKASPKSFVTLFVKPAPDNYMIPKDVEKVFDICFPANGSQPFKGHSWVFETKPNDISLMHLGISPKIILPPNAKSYKVHRKEIAKYYSKCKIGIVCSNNDSCPRVIPEMLACNLPIICLDTFHIWDEMYINGGTGIRTNKEAFWNAVRYALDNMNRFNPREIYCKNLSMSKCIKHIQYMIDFDKRGRKPVQCY